MKATRPVVALGLGLLLSLIGGGAASGELPEPAPAFAVPAQNPAALHGAAYPLSAFAVVGSALVQSGHLAEFGWSEAQISAFLEGARDAFNGKTQPVDVAAERLHAEIGRQLAEIQAREKRKVAEAFALPGRLEQYMKETRKRYGLQQTDSGLAYSIQGGRPGIRPGPDDTVVISCIATAADGATRLPQLSSGRVSVKMAGLVPGFVEGLQMMNVDSQAMFVIPPALSFGAGVWPEGVDRGTPLIFFITLHEVISAEAAR